MTDFLFIVGLVSAVAIGGVLGWLLARLRSQRRIIELSTTLELERRQAQANIHDLEKTFSALSSQALSRNNQTFLQLAQESLKQFHIQAKGDLEQKEKAVENLVKPIREALEKSAVKKESQ